MALPKGGEGGSNSTAQLQPAPTGHSTSPGGEEEGDEGFTDDFQQQQLQEQQQQQGGGEDGSMSPTQAGRLLLEAAMRGDQEEVAADSRFVLPNTLTPPMHAHHRRPAHMHNTCTFVCRWCNCCARKIRIQMWPAWCVLAVCSECFNVCLLCARFPECCSLGLNLRTRMLCGLPSDHPCVLLLLRATYCCCYC
jgi:hypothetical protein